METVERLVQECETYENCNDQNKNKCDLNIVVDVNKGELQELVENINSIVTGLKETKDLSNKYDSVRQKIEKLQSDFNKKEGKKVLKEYRELTKYLTFTIEADSLKTARARLTRIGLDLLASAARIRFRWKDSTRQPWPKRRAVL